MIPEPVHPVVLAKVIVYPTRVFERWILYNQRGQKGQKENQQEPSVTASTGLCSLCLNHRSAFPFVLLFLFLFDFDRYYLAALIITAVGTDAMRHNHRTAVRTL